MILLWLLRIGGLIRTAISYVIDLFLRYPLQFILVLVFLYAFWQKTRYDAIVSDYTTYKTNIAQQVKIQQAKNEILQKQAVAKVTEIVAIHTKQIEAVKNDYEKRNKINAGTIANLRNELRDKIRADSFNLPEAPSNTAWTTEDWRERYTRLAGQHQTLRDGCTITTIDYNALRGWADSACNQVGCD